MGIKAIFGANLKHYRKRKDLSQEQLAEMVNITPKHLSTIETGTTFVSAELLERITATLHVSASALFYTVTENMTDESLFGRIDEIIEKELLKTSESIRIQIRY
jgi:transcriptional regulator with XRE-family HTH domain